MNKRKHVASDGKIVIRMTWETEIREPPLLVDAQVWMKLAKMLYESNIPIRHERCWNELNVAAVCAGYAFELIFKVLAQAATMEQPEGKHEPSIAYKFLKEKKQGRAAEIDRIINRWRWNEDELLKYLDRLCKVDRKYWMRPRPEKNGGNANNKLRACVGGGMKGFDVLAKLHADLSDLARKWVEEPLGESETTK